MENVNLLAAISMIVSIASVVLAVVAIRFARMA